MHLRMPHSSAVGWFTLYLEASLGKITVVEFWQRLATKISPSYIITGREDEVFLEGMELKENNVTDLLSYL